MGSAAHRINLVFDGKPISGALDLGSGEQIEFGATSCGHILGRLMTLIYRCTSLDDVRTRLRDAFVIIDPAERKMRFSMLRGRWLFQIVRLMRPNLRLFGDIAGLVEWPTLLMGRLRTGLWHYHQNCCSPPYGFEIHPLARSMFSKYFIVVSDSAVLLRQVIVAGNQEFEARLTDAEFLEADQAGN